MIHVVHLVRRRFPDRGGRVAGTLLALSAGALALGIALLAGL